MAEMPKYYKIHTDGRVVDLEPIYIDLAPVVRCKDCKHRRNWEMCPMVLTRICYDGDGHFDLVETDETVDNGFCHCGKREE